MPPTTEQEIKVNGATTATVTAKPATTAASIPRYQRRAPTFDEMLGAPAAQVIPAMDTAGDDIPYQRPDFGITLPSVGLDRTHVPVRLADPLGSSETCIVSCAIAVRTSVPPERRGIHTSRIGNAIAGCSTVTHATLQAYALELARRIDEAEYGGRTEVLVTGEFAYVEEVVGWKAEKDKQSLEHLSLHARAVLLNGEPSVDIGVTLNHITACPCVQQTYKHALTEAKGDIRHALDVIGPMLTHSQRCRTRVDLQGIGTEVSVRELLEALDETLYRVQNTLPREHELLLVYRAHKEPQFIEDAMRQVLTAVGKAFGERHPDATVHVHAVSYESIHDYDIVADVDMKLSAVV